MKKQRRCFETESNREAAAHVRRASGDMPIVHLATDDFETVERILYGSGLAYYREASVKEADAAGTGIPPEQRNAILAMGGREALQSFSEAGERYRQGKAGADRKKYLSTVPAGKKAAAGDEWFRNREGEPFAVCFGGLPQGTAGTGLRVADIEELHRYLEAWHRQETENCYAVLYGKTLTLPAGMEEFIEHVEIPPLSLNDFTQILAERNQGTALLPWENEWYFRQMGGFDEGMVCRTVLRIANSNRQNIRIDRENDKKRAEAIIIDVKKQRLLRHRKLTCETVSYAPNTGFHVPSNIEKWITDHEASLRDIDIHKRSPKGMLLVGVPGTGKSGTAREIARRIELPLVQLKIGDLLGGLMGDSEHNMTQALEDLEFLSPCVLWVDELEKALGGNGKSGDSDLMTRLMGQLLTFLQESKRKVFMVATANDVDSLPPELLRNGRIDVRFFMMMPTWKECLDIMKGKLINYGYEKSEALPLSEALLSVCVGTLGVSHLRFLTGADIDLMVNELMGRVTKRNENESVESLIPKYKMIMKEQVLPYICAYGDSRYHKNIENIAKCYRKLLPQGMLPSEKDGQIREWFNPERYHPEWITEFWYEPGDGRIALPSCMAMPRSEELPAGWKIEHGGAWPDWSSAEGGTKPENFYDICLFREIVEEMDRQLLEEARPEVFAGYMRCKRVKQ